MRPPRATKPNQRFPKDKVDPRSPLRRSAPGRCLWDMKETFSFKIDQASNYNFEKHYKVSVHITVITWWKTVVIKWVCSQQL